MDGQSEADDELPCRELVELVTDYLERALDLPERARFEAHLRECEGCRDYLDQIERTILLLGRTAATRPTAAERERLLALFRSVHDPAASG